MIFLGGGSILFYLISFVSTILMFTYFCSKDCKLNQFFVSFNLVLMIISTIMAIHPKVQESNPQSGLSQASVVSIYATFSVFSAISNSPDTNCNVLNASEHPRLASIVVGSILTFLALVYSTSNAASQGKNMLNEENMELLATGESQGDEEDDTSYNFSFFHIVYALGAVYVSMLVTNWDSIKTNDSGMALGLSYEAMWAKIISSWLNFGLYMWTLVAPIILSEREWY
jgi:hypothetical protein